MNFPGARRMVGFAGIGYYTPSVHDFIIKIRKKGSDRKSPSGSFLSLL
jgi:hypothetical protein